MKTTKKKSMTGLIVIVTIVAVLISAGCIGEKTPPSVPTSTPTPTPTTTETPSPAPTPTTEFEGAVSLANVNDIEILLLESFPVQIHAVARGEHPDSCTKVDKVATRREGDTFFVTITTSRPADAMCAQVMTPFEEVVALDVVGLKAGVYTVDVNGVQDTFELQTDNIF